MTIFILIVLVFVILILSTSLKSIIKSMIEQFTRGRCFMFCTLTVSILAICFGVVYFFL